MVPGWWVLQTVRRQKAEGVWVWKWTHRNVIKKLHMQKANSFALVFVMLYRKTNGGWAVEGNNKHGKKQIKL